jgi:hypothetical protein
VDWLRAYKNSGKVIKRTKCHFRNTPPPASSSIPDVIFDDEIDDLQPGGTPSSLSTPGALTSSTTSTPSMVECVQFPDSVDDDSEDEADADVELSRPSSTTFKYKKIPLANLFRYPAASTPLDQLPRFWHLDGSFLDDEEEIDASLASSTSTFNETNS